MDKKQYMTPVAEVLAVRMERCILSDQYGPDEQGYSSVENAHYRDGQW